MLSSCVCSALVEPTTLFNSAVLALRPSSLFISAVEAVTPVSLFISAVEAVTPSSLFISDASAVTPCYLCRSYCTISEYTSCRNKSLLNLLLYSYCVSSNVYLIQAL